MHGEGGVTVPSTPTRTPVASVVRTLRSPQSMQPLQTSTPLLGIGRGVCAATDLVVRPSLRRVRDADLEEGEVVDSTHSDKGKGKQPVSSAKGHLRGKGKGKKTNTRRKRAKRS